MSQGKIVLMACGSFSPPTPMHLRMFEIARDYINSLGLHTVIGGIISPVHDAYGKKGLVSASHRHAMLKLALTTSDWIKVSDWEMNQEGWTRTKETLQYHQNQINNFMKNGPFNNRDLPSWLPNEILNRLLNNNYDEIDNMPQMYDNIRNSINDNNMKNQNNRSEHVQLKLLCGADLLESFATPGLWAEEDLEVILGNHGLVVVSRSGNNPERFIHDSDLLTKFRRNLTIVTNWVPNDVSSTVIRRLMRRGESVKYLIDDVLISYIKQHQLFGVVSSKDAIEYQFLTEAAVINYNTHSSITPDDISMTSPENNSETHTSIKNILISIRDKPTIVDEQISVTKKRKSNFLVSIHNSRTDSVAPLLDAAPKMAYVESSPNILPGKVVKIIKDIDGNHTIVSPEDEIDTEGKTACLL